jgi:hypothetical protein
MTRSGYIPIEKWQRVGARNIPILCYKIAALMSHQGWHLSHAR